VFKNEILNITFCGLCCKTRARGDESKPFDIERHMQSIKLNNFKVLWHMSLNGIYEKLTRIKMKCKFTLLLRRKFLIHNSSSDENITLHVEKCQNILKFLLCA
jgi:hypothetical protein